MCDPGINLVVGYVLGVAATYLQVHINKKRKKK